MITAKLVKDDGESKYYLAESNDKFWADDAVNIIKETDDDLFPGYQYEFGHFNSEDKFVALLKFDLLKSIIKH